MAVVATPEQRAVLDRITAFMSLVEGHAEYVMNAVPGDGHPVPGGDREAVRRPPPQGWQRARPALRRLLGLEAKTRQYVDGSAFVRTVIDRVGLDGFNAIWTSRQTLPTKAEIAEPLSWIKRVHA